MPKTVWNWPPNYEWTVKLSIWDGVEPGRIFGGGESGIRTHGTVARTPVFETGAFVHSAISPQAGPGGVLAVVQGICAINPAGEGLDRPCPAIRELAIQCSEIRILRQGGMPGKRNERPGMPVDSRVSASRAPSAWKPGDRSPAGPTPPGSSCRPSAIQLPVPG